MGIECFRSRNASTKLVELPTGPGRVNRPSKTQLPCSAGELCDQAGSFAGLPPQAAEIKWRKLVGPDSH